MEMKVLVVDDEEGFASLLAGHLKARDISAECVYLGKKALDRVLHFRPDVVILDMQMPDIHGVEVLAQIESACPDVEVIVLTGNTSFDTGIECMKLGAFDYIFKPVDVDELIETIESAFLKKTDGR